MKDEILPARIVCEGGLNTNENSLVLSADLPGGAIKLINYESSISGGYRRINGYRLYDADVGPVGGANAEGKVLGLYNFYNSGSRVNEIYAARKDISGDTYSIYKLIPGGWEAVTLPNPRTTVGANFNVVRLRFEVYNAGSGNNLFIVDGCNPLLWYNGTAWQEIEIEAQNTQVLKSPNVIAVFKNHLFVACDQLDETVVAHSAPNDPSDWSSAGGSGQIYPGFEVQNIRPFRDELYVFGVSRIRKIIVDSTDFVLKDVTNDLGCIARDSILEVGGNLLFLSQDGIRPVAGTDKISDVDLGLLSRDIQPDMDKLISEGDLETLNGVVIKKKTQFRYFYANEAVVTNEAQGLIGCVTQNKRTGRDWEWSTLSGIRASCTWSGMVQGREIVLHGDFDGNVYQQEQGSSFNGEPIYSLYQTPYLDFGNTEIRKTFRTMNLFMKNEGSSEIFLGYQFNWGDRDTITPSNDLIDQNVNNFFFDRSNATFDTPGVVYGGGELAKLMINISGSGESISFIFYSEGAFAPYTIQGFVVEYTERGRQ